MVGGLLALRSGATTCSRLLMGRLLEHVPRLRLIVGSAVGAAAALAVVPLPGVGVPGAALGLVVGGSSPGSGSR